MAKVDKMALVRLALRHTINELDNRELLCVLADMYIKPPDSAPRWWGNGDGTGGLEQGIYSSMITFRRMSNLWEKLTTLALSDKAILHQETIVLRDFIVDKLRDRGVNLDQVREAEQGNE